MAEKNESGGKFVTRIMVSVFLVLALIVFLFVLHYVTRWVVDGAQRIHWFSIALSAVAFFFAGAMAGVQVFKNEHWMPTGKNGRSYWVYDPIGKTEKEVDAFVDKHFKKDGFATSDLTIVIAFLVFDAIPLGIGLYLSPYVLNAVIAFPAWILAALLFRLPSGDSYLNDVLGDDWKEYVCPHCGGICGKFRYSTTNHKESEWIGSRQVTVTDKYTNGVDTVWVDRTETQYHINHNTSFDMVYNCPRCKRNHVKKFSYTEQK